MADVFSFSVQLALTIILPLWIVRYDLRRLPEQQEARAWPDASLWMSVVVFGPLCLPFHFIKTRRSLWGVVVGVFWLAVSMVSITLIGAALALLFGLD